MCYGGDVGLHIGKTIWGMIKNKSAFPEDSDSLEDKVKFLGDSYVFGTNQYEDDLVAKKEIENINKKVFEYKAGVATDEDIEVSYKKGKEWSLALFHKMYQRLSTDFDYEVFESEVSYEGQKIVENNILNGVFEKSEGAVVFNGEKEGRKAGLHTRVFINSQGLPTYEAKELGLVFKKFVLSDWDESVVITANEQKDYYQVFLGALSEIDLEKTNKTKHFSHGMLRLTSGKMSSRRGNVVLAEDFLEEIKTEVMEKMKDSKKIEEHNETLKNDIAEKVAIGAIKYVILRQSTGKDVIYDSKSALSFEGDSGPYLQYSIARAKSVLRKAKEKDLKPIPSILRTHLSIEEVTVLEKMLYRFPEVVARAGEEYAPQLVTTYLIELASAFNSWYGTNVIVSDEIEAPYRVALTTAFVLVMQNGLQILAIPVPERM